MEYLLDEIQSWMKVVSGFILGRVALDGSSENLILIVAISAILFCCDAILSWVFWQPCNCGASDKKLEKGVSVVEEVRDTFDFDE